MLQKNADSTLTVAPICLDEEESDRLLELLSTRRPDAARAVDEAISRARQRISPASLSDLLAPA